MVKHNWMAVLIGVLILPSLVGCGPGNAGTVLQPQAPATRPAREAQPTGYPEGPVAPISATQVKVEDQTLSGTQAQPPLGDDSTESVRWARRDLAQRLGISIDGVTVAAVIGQEFTSDAFYCRVTKERISKTEPPAVISGSSILLHALGRRYEYHASGQTVLFCRPLP